MEVIKARKFCNDKEKILKKYPKSQEEIDDHLKEVIKEPNSGKIYPGLENARKKAFSYNDIQNFKEKWFASYLYL